MRENRLMATRHLLANFRPSSGKDLILRRMEAIGWRYATRDVEAVHELWARALAAAVANKPITYSNWVSGVEFAIPTINAGASFHIDTAAWRSLDGDLAGDFASFMSARSYYECGGLISAFIVGKGRNQPSQAFFDWAASVGVTRSLPTLDSQLAFWVKQMQVVHQHYKASADGDGAVRFDGAPLHEASNPSDLPLNRPALRALIASIDDPLDDLVLEDQHRYAAGDDRDDDF